MTRTRSQPEHLAHEAARWRRRYRHAQKIIEEQNDQLLAQWLRGRLQDPRDFHAFIGLPRITTDDGRIDWQLATRLLNDLLDAKPHLKPRLPPELVG